MCKAICWIGTVGISALGIFIIGITVETTIGTMFLLIVAYAAINRKKIFHKT